MKTIRIACQSADVVNLDDLVPFQGTLKLLTDEAYQKLKLSILELGFSFPIQAWRHDDKQYILDAHQRFETLKKMRDEDGYEIPPLPVSWIEASNRKEAAKKVLAATSQYGIVTPDGLYQFMDNFELDMGEMTSSFQFPEIDFSEFQKDFFPETINVSEHERSGPGGIDEDEVPEVIEPKTKLGDIYQLGRHRLICGDCTNGDVVEKLMNGEKASVWASDPPYGINYVSVANEKGQAKGYKSIANDDKQNEELKEFIYKSITVSKPFMADGFAFYMWHAMKMQAYFSQAAAAAGILFHRQIIWVKPQFVFGRGQYHWRHELCLMGWLSGNEPPFYGKRNQSTIWEIGRENDKIHPTQKPVALWEPAILNHTKQNEIIFEPFAGSGSNIIACEKNDRRCFAIELEPHYCDIIVARYCKYTNQSTVNLNGNNISWE